MRNYELFMRDFAEENSPEDFSQLSPYEIYEEDREGVYKTNFYMRDNLQIPIVQPILATQKNRDSIVDFVGKYLDSHADQLSTTGPVYIVTFRDKETKVLYDMFGTDGDKLYAIYNEMVNVTYNGKISKFYTGLLTHAPHKILLTAMLAEAYAKKYDDIITCCELMYAFTEYPIIYRKFWKIGVKEEVMNYTIEHLGAKYKAKQMKNILELLKYDAHAAVSFFSDKMADCADNVYNDLMQRMRNQIQSKMRNIARAYFKNVENNAAQHANVTEFDDGEIAEQEGHNSNMSTIIDKTNAKLAYGEINKGMVRIVAEKNQVDRSNIEGMISSIQSTKNNRIDKFAEDVITLYFVKNPSAVSLSASEFLNFGLSLYRSIGMSKDKMMVELKDIMNLWMDDIINIRSMYQREATVINYRRAIYDYFILMINYYN